MVAIHADLAICIEVVKQHILLGEGAVVRRDVIPEDTQIRIAITLWKVSKDLIVGSVFLDDVDHILDRAGHTGFCRDDCGCLIHGSWRGSIRAVLQNGRGVRFQLRWA